MKVMIVVTHLLGTGHLARALTLGRGFQTAGDDVTVVSGGTPVAHFDTVGLTFEQVTPVRSNGVDFSILLTTDGDAAGDDILAARQTRLLSLIEQTQPDILITELFPFGRRIMRNEFGAVLAAAKAMAVPPLILTSIRDILAPPTKQKKARFADDMVGPFYDGILVHSDPDVVRLDHSWPVTDAMKDKLHYTGFVAPQPPIVTGQRGNTVLVSAGGGTVGDALFAVAVNAAKDTPHLSWQMMVGGTDARRSTLAQGAGDNVSIQPPHPDFRQFLTTAAASVSMAGYNTALDVLQTGVPAVLVPFDDGGEVEQGLRAEALAQLPGVSVMRQEGLTGDMLARAVNDVIAAGHRPPRTQGMNGAAKAVEIAHRLRKEAV